MRVTLWMSERSLEQFHKGELVEGMIFQREPGEHVDVVQVSVTYDEYRQIQDQQTDPTTWSDGTPKTGYGYSSEHEKQWECSLPEGAEWDVEYSITDENKNQ